MKLKQAPYFVEYFRGNSTESLDLSMGLSSLVHAKEHGMDVAHQHKYTRFRVVKKQHDGQIINVGFWTNQTPSGTWRKMTGYGFAPKVSSL